MAQQTSTNWGAMYSKNDIRGTGLCAVCKKSFPTMQLKMCAGCKMAGPYCGKNCQAKDWRAQHKQVCGKSDLQIEVFKDPIEICAKKLVKNLRANPRLTCFPTAKGMTSLVSLVQEARSNFSGQGFYIQVFPDRKGLRDFDYGISINRAGVHDYGPNFNSRGMYIPWPLDLDPSSEEYDLQQRLVQLGIDDAMSSLKESEFVAGVCLEKGEGLHFAIFDCEAENIVKQPRDTAFVATQLVLKIESDPAYLQCRNQMRKLRQHFPGVLMLGNIISRGELYFSKSDLKKVNPDLLLKELIHAGLALVGRGQGNVAGYGMEDGTGSNQGMCSMFPAYATLVAQHKDFIMREDVFVGFFLLENDHNENTVQNPKKHLVMRMFKIQL